MKLVETPRNYSNLVAKEFLAGFSSSPILLYLFVVVPWTVDQLFSMGLNDTPLIIVACAIPIAFFMLFLVLLPGDAVRIAHVSVSIAAGTLAMMVGMLFYITFDETSNASAVFVALYLVAGFVAVYFTILGKNPPRPLNVTEGQTPRFLAYGGGIVTPLLITGLLVQITGMGEMAYFVISIVHVTAMLSQIASRRQIEQENHISLESEAKGISMRSRHYAINLETTMLMLLVLPAVFIFSSFVNVLAIDLALSAYEYLALGILMMFFLWDHSWKLRVAVPWILFWLFWVFMIITPAMGFDWGTRAAGLAMGIVFGEILLKATSLPRSPRRSTEGLVLFFLLVLIVLGAALGNEYQSIIEDEEAYMWIPVLIIVVIGVIITTLTFVERIAIKNKTRGVLLREFFKPVVHDNRAFASRKKMNAVLLAALVGIPLCGVAIGINANVQVHIELDTTMYDVYGNAVSAVDLLPGTAKILLFTKDPVGTPHGELIRVNKSVRIGGYYYGYQNSTCKPFTKAEVVEWVGDTNDVFSFGFMGTSGDMMMPEDINAIKGNNSQARFYYMAFATTLYEYSGSPGGTGPTWGNSHYPNVQFNNTLNGMTLKLANGSEAIGVRREFNGDDAHLMDLGNSTWADYFAWIYENRSKQFYANGVAIDEVMWEGYWDVDKKNNGIQLRDYATKEQIRATCYDWLERIDSLMDVEIITQAFWPESQVHQQGVWGEIAFRAGNIYGRRVDDRKRSVWYDIAPMNWMDIVGNMYDIASQNKSYIWAAWYEPGDVVGLEYAISTYLMGKPNNCTWLVFQPHPGHYPEQNLVGYAVRTVKDEVETHHQLFDVELGDATGTMELKTGLGGQYYQRSFQNGIVLVNPFHAKIPWF